MTKKVQQRIVGMIAIISLLLVILPFFLSNDDHIIQNNGLDFNDDKITVITNNPNQNSETITDNSAENITGNEAVINETIVETVEEPVPEAIWNQATQQNSAQIETTTETAAETANDQSIASQILAEEKKNSSLYANVVINTPENPAKKQPDVVLPPIDLVGVTETTPSKTEPKQQNKPNTAQKKERWYLQVGSFSKKAGAEKTASNFRAKGYTMDILQTSGQYKVRIGPINSKNAATKTQNTLKNQGINTILIQSS